MSLVTSKEMLLDAQKGGYAVGAFNAENMEMVKAIIAAAEELKAPVMIQTTPSTINYGTLETYTALVHAEAQKASVPVALHLDHGNSFELSVRAIREGYTSIMIDGSGSDFEGNIDVTRRVVAVAAPNQIPVEAELVKVRDQGYALDAREMEDHMECVGAPVFGSDNSVVGAISVSSLYKPGEDYDALGRMVCQKAEEVSRLLGFLGKKS